MAANDPARRLVEEQANDPGLWFLAETAPESYLQAALRRLHAVIESAAPPEGITALLERWREQAQWWRDHWSAEQEANWPDGYYRPSEQYDKFADELAAVLRPDKETA